MIILNLVREFNSHGGLLDQLDSARPWNRVVQRTTRRFTRDGPASRESRWLHYDHPQFTGRSNGVSLSLSLSLSLSPGSSFRFDTRPQHSSRSCCSRSTKRFRLWEQLKRVAFPSLRKFPLYSQKLRSDDGYGFSRHVANINRHFRDRLIITPWHMVALLKDAFEYFWKFHRL